MNILLNVWSLVQGRIVCLYNSILKILYVYHTSVKVYYTKLTRLGLWFLGTGQFGGSGLS